MSFNPKHFIPKMFLRPSGFLTRRFGRGYAVLRQRFRQPSEPLLGASGRFTRCYGRRFALPYAILRALAAEFYVKLRAFLTRSYGSGLEFTRTYGNGFTWNFGTIWLAPPPTRRPCAPPRATRQRVTRGPRDRRSRPRWCVQRPRVSPRRPGSQPAGSRVHRPPRQSDGRNAAHDAHPVAFLRLAPPCLLEYPPLFRPRGGNPTRSHRSGPHRRNKQCGARPQT